MKKILIGSIAAGLFAVTTAFACPGVEGCNCDMKAGSDHSKCSMTEAKKCSDCTVVDGKKVMCAACLDKKAAEEAK